MRDAIEGGGIGWGFGSGISTGIGNTKSSVSTSSEDVKQNAMLSPFSGIGASDLDPWLHEGANQTQS